VSERVVNKFQSAWGWMSSSPSAASDDRSASPIAFAKMGLPSGLPERRSTTNLASTGQSRFGFDYGRQHLYGAIDKLHSTASAHEREWFSKSWRTLRRVDRPQQRHLRSRDVIPSRESPSTSTALPESSWKTSCTGSLRHRRRAEGRRPRAVRLMHQGKARKDGSEGHAGSDRRVGPRRSACRTGKDTRLTRARDLTARRAPHDLRPPGGPASFRAAVTDDREGKRKS